MIKSKLKIFVAVVLLIALVLLSFGCGMQTPQQGGETQTTEQSGEAKELDRTEVDLAMIGGSLDYVREQNRLSDLLDMSESVHLFSTFSDGSEAHTIYFRFHEKNAWADVILSETEKRVNCGEVEGMSFYCEPGKRVKVTLDADTYSGYDGSDMENAIADCISVNGQVESVEDLGGRLKVTVSISSEEDPMEKTWDIYVLDKGTLHLIEAFYMDGDGVKIGGNSVEYNGDDEGIVSNFLTAWEELRTVTFVYDRYLPDVDKVTTETLSVDVPATWEATPSYYEETFLYMDRDNTKEYVYPGDSKSYTVYVTNVAG